jgi:GT2 family glycosyltransferase
MDFSIIIVNYNTIEQTKNCIDSILKYTVDILYEIILIDNNSSDGSNKYFINYPDIKFFQNKENVGFARANNLGANIATGKYILFLNPDTILLNNALKYFYDFFESQDKEKNIGALGCYLLNSDLTLANSYFKFPTILSNFKSELNIILKKLFKSNFIKNTRINYKGSVRTLEVDYVIGAALMIKREIFIKINGFDNDFFLYFEETDIQKRLKLIGFNNYVITGPKIIHFGGQSSIKDYSYLKYKINYFKSNFIYFRKHHTFIENLIMRILITPLLLRFLFVIKYPKSLRLKLIKLLFK